MNRRIFLKITVWSLAFAAAFLACSEEQKVVASEAPAPVIICDFHRTLANTDYPRAVVAGICHLPIIIPRLLVRALWTHSVVGHLWRTGSLNKYPWDALVDTFGAPASHQKLRMKAFSLLKEIKDKKRCSAIVFFSGITPYPLRQLQGVHPDEFSVFDATICCGDEHNWLSKRGPELYEICHQKIQEQSSGRPIMFLDDLPQNGVFGAKHGWAYCKVVTESDAVKHLRQLLAQHSPSLTA